MKKFFSINADLAGAITAITCAVHCMALPLIASIGFPALGSHNHAFDWFFMGLGLLFAGYSLIKDLITKHNNFIPLIIASIGFLLLFVGIESHGSLIVLSVIGGILIAYSHLQNWKLSHQVCSTF